MNETDGSGKAKWHCQTPALILIGLRPEETVLGHCKNPHLLRAGRQDWTAVRSCVNRGF